jgi:hypothetical protein
MSPQKLAELGDLAVVSSIAADGTPQSAVVAIAVTPNLEIVFDTVNTSRKYRNLVDRPECSIVIWKGEVTVQYEGIAEIAGADFQKIYFNRFPEGRDRLTWPGITYFVVRPKWIRHSNFNARPPEISEFSF